MHFIAAKNILSTAANNAQKAVSLQHTNPLLTCLHLEIEDTLLYITGTDQEFGVKCKVPVTAIKDGTVALPARYVTSLLNKLPDVDINIQLDQTNQCTSFIYGLDNELVLNSYPTDDFPMFPKLPKQPVLKIKQNIFKKMLKTVLFAVDNDERRPIFTGLYIYINEAGVLFMVGTDTRKLAVCKQELKNPPENKFSIIVPGKALMELYKILEDDEQEFDIYLTDNRVFFVLDQIQVMSRLIAGQYPDYRIVIPDHYQCEIKVHVDTLLETVERAALLIDAKRQAISINFHSQGLTTYFYTETGRIREEIMAEFSGKPIDVGFNVKLFIDLLKAIDTEEVIIKLSGRKTPALFLPVEKENYFSLLVPAITG